MKAVRVEGVGDWQRALARVFLRAEGLVLDVDEAWRSNDQVQWLVLVRHLLSYCSLLLAILTLAHRQHVDAPQTPSAHFSRVVDRTALGPTSLAGYAFDVFLLFQMPLGRETAAL